jgi:hypothetical protein
MSGVNVENSEKGEHWQLEPDEHDFPAARRFLTLVCPPSLAARLAKLLERAPTSTYQAKDLLRASGLQLLEETNKHVASDLQKVRDGRKLSPVLLVRGRFEKNRYLIIADGYHRICASYWIDENSVIPCRVVDLPK